jgi:hypothetical protein
LDDPITEVRTEELGGVQVHFPAQQFGQFLFHRKECQAWSVVGLKLHQYIQIAVGPSIAVQHRAEDGEFADMMPSAKFRDRTLR